jgi:hypothetical protein
MEKRYEVVEDTSKDYSPGVFDETLTTRWVVNNTQERCIIRNPIYLPSDEEKEQYVPLQKNNQQYFYWIFTALILIIGILLTIIIKGN